MTVSEKVDLQKKYTAEERDAIFEAYADACGAGEREKAARIRREMPLHPRWAKIILNVMGKDYLLEHFNVSYADEVFGEDWLHDK